jgi:hypothetical protein
MTGDGLEHARGWREPRIEDIGVDDLVPAVEMLEIGPDCFEEGTAVIARLGGDGQSWLADG